MAMCVAIYASMGIVYSQVRVLDQVVLGTVLGVVIGWTELAFRLSDSTHDHALGVGFSKFMKFALGRGYIDRESYVAQYLALAVLTIGVCSVLGVDDLLGAFAAGAKVFSPFLCHREVYALRYCR
jgi:hypothetical protein